jgi:hypothetical protein
MESLDRTATEQMLQRIYGEFMEMPGLKLSCRQAQRLLGLDEPACRHLLQILVDTNFLTCHRNGTYARRTEGRSEFPRPQRA